MSDGWDSDPFTLDERVGRLYARGVVDNKGQVLIHMVSIFELIQQGTLGFNVVFIIEGDEETGQARMRDFLVDHEDYIQPDFSMFSDGETPEEYPTIDAGFRGGFNATLTLKTSHTDLHSGIYGGATPSAAHELGVFIAGLHDRNNHVSIEGFYDDVDDISDAVLNEHKARGYDLAFHQSHSGTRAILTEPEYDFYTQVGLRPTVQVTGIESGYSGTGYRNSIPSSATAKLNFRLVKSQRAERVIELFKQHMERVLPHYVDYELDYVDPHQGVKINFENSIADRTVQVLTQSHGAVPVKQYCGGGIPIVADLADIYQIPVLSVGLGNIDCGMHAPNENFRIDFIERGLRYSKMFFANIK